MRMRVKIQALLAIVFFTFGVNIYGQSIGLYGAGFVSNYHFKERYTFHNGAGFGGFFSVPLWVLDLGVDVQYFKRARRENDVLVTYCKECRGYSFPPQIAGSYPVYKSLTDRIFISTVLSFKCALDFRVVTRDSFHVKIGPRFGINYLRQVEKYTNENIPPDHALAVYSPSLGVESSFYWKYAFGSPKIGWFIKPGADAIATGNWQGITDADVAFSDLPLTLLLYVKAGILFGKE